MALRGGPLEQRWSERTQRNALGRMIGASAFGYFCRDWQK